MPKFKEPNHICKNNECKKAYYACDYCDRISSWRSMCCSIECYDKYMEQLLIARGKNIAPERTDKTEAEVQELMNTPVEQVLEATKEELGEFFEEYNTSNIDEVVEMINENIDKETTKSTKKRRNK